MCALRYWSLIDVHLQGGKDYSEDGSGEDEKKPAVKSLSEYQKILRDKHCCMTHSSDDEPQYCYKSGDDKQCVRLDGEKITQWAAYMVCSLPSISFIQSQL